MLSFNVHHACVQKPRHVRELDQPLLELPPVEMPSMSIRREVEGHLYRRVASPHRAMAVAWQMAVAGEIEADRARQAAAAQRDRRGRRRRAAAGDGHVDLHERYFRGFGRFAGRTPPSTLRSPITPFSASATAFAASLGCCFTPSSTCIVFGKPCPARSVFDGVHVWVVTTPAWLNSVTKALIDAS